MQAVITPIKGHSSPLHPIPGPPNPPPCPAVIKEEKAWHLPGLMWADTAGCQ